MFFLYDSQWLEQWEAVDVYLKACCHMSGEIWTLSLSDDLERVVICNRGRSSGSKV